MSSSRQLLLHGVVTTVSAEQPRPKGHPFAAEEAADIGEPSLRKYDEEGSTSSATARLWDDGILDPAETRSALALGLSAAYNAPVPGARFGVLRM